MIMRHSPESYDTMPSLREKVASTVFFVTLAVGAVSAGAAFYTHFVPSEAERAAQEAGDSEALKDAGAERNVIAGRLGLLSFASTACAVGAAGFIEASTKPS